MKDIFKILQEEKDRILGMHESATKNQYLNEQSFGPYSTGNYQLDSAVANLPNQPLPKKPSKVSKYTTQKWNQFEGGFGFTYGLPKGTVFSATKDPNIVTAINANVFKKVSGPGKEWEQKRQRVSFYCNKGKFYVESSSNFNLVNKNLATALVTYVCGYKPTGETQPTTPPVKDNTQLNDSQKLERAKKCGHASWDEYKKSNWSCSAGVNQSKGTQTTQTNSQLITLNKQIQQSLGNQKPTGQITDAEIDSILVKLG
jgi:hypothetical protein